MTYFEIKTAKAADQTELRYILVQNGQKPTIVIDENSLYLFAEIEGQKIALIGTELSGNAALIRSLAVLKQWRNRGIAIELTTILFNELKRKGISNLYLFSRDTGSYWQKIGFTECNVQEIIDHLPRAPQVLGYINDNSIWTDMAWRKSI